MRVIAHPADRGGCGFYRIEAPARALKRQGHDVRIARDFSYRALWQPNAWGVDRIVGLARVVDADVVVLQRPMHRHRVGLIEALQAQGVAVVVEIDDDFHAIHPKNPAWEKARVLGNADHNRDWLKLACEKADLVTVTTPALAERYGHHGRVAILPNYVPQSYLALRRSASGSRVTVGWAGSIDTHPGDLEETGDSIASVCSETGAAFAVVGTGVGVGKALGLDADPPGTGWVPLDRYPRTLAVTMDVGIAPLSLTPFNSAKSALKMLEMASVGVPPVGSPTEANRWIASLGVGELADSPSAWRESVLRLVKDREYRKAVADRSYAAAQALTIERNCHQWWDAWGRAVENMRAAA